MTFHRTGSSRNEHEFLLLCIIAIKIVINFKLLTIGKSYLLVICYTSILFQFTFLIHLPKFDVLSPEEILTVVPLCNNLSNKKFSLRSLG